VDGERELVPVVPERGKAADPGVGVTEVLVDAENGDGDALERGVGVEVVLAVNCCR